MPPTRRDARATIPPVELSTQPRGAAVCSPVEGRGASGSNPALASPMAISHSHLHRSALSRRIRDKNDTSAEIPITTAAEAETYVGDRRGGAGLGSVRLAAEGLAPHSAGQGRVCVRDGCKDAGPGRENRIPDSHSSHIGVAVQSRSRKTFCPRLNASPWRHGRWRGCRETFAAGARGCTPWCSGPRGFGNACRTEMACNSPRGGWTGALSHAGPDRPSLLQQPLQSAQRHRPSLAIIIYSFSIVCCERLTLRVDHRSCRVLRVPP